MVAVWVRVRVRLLMSEFRARLGLELGWRRVDVICGCEQVCGGASVPHWRRPAESIRGNSWRTVGYWCSWTGGHGTPRTRRSTGRRHRSDCAAEMTVLHPPAPPPPSTSKSITHPYLLAPGLNDEERPLRPLPPS